MRCVVEQHDRERRRRRRRGAAHPMLHRHELIAASFPLD